MANAKKIKTASSAGLSRPDVTVGPADPVRARIARKAIGAGGFGSRNREAGMLIDTSQVSAPYSTGYKLEAYRSSYAYGLSDRTGAYDIPTYFVQMNEQNGGMLYWPVTLHEKLSWYRYFARTDAYIGRALELLSDLPMSKLTLNMPKAGGKLTKKLSEEILAFCTYQLEVINAFEMCQSTLWELNMIGNCFTGETPILTKEGLIPIREIREGDTVVDKNGGYATVFKTMRRSIREKINVVRLERMAGYSERVTDEHPYFVMRHGKEVMVYAKDLVKGDLVAVPKISTVVDRSQIDVAQEIEEILSGYYDSFTKRENGSGYEVDVVLKSLSETSCDSVETKKKILGWMSMLQSPTELTCAQVAETIGVSDVGYLRQVVCNMTKRGQIKTENINKGSGGYVKKWYPSENGAEYRDVVGKSIERTYESLIGKIDVNDDFMYVLGYWLGDGWLWHSKAKVREFEAFDIVFGEEERDRAELVEKRCVSVFGRDSVSLRDGSFCNDSLIHVVVEDSIFCKWWAENFGTGCKDKKIPSWVMNLPASKLEWLLKGLIDSDGCVSKTKSGLVVSIGMVNERLVQQIFHIGIKCGFPFCYDVETRKASIGPRGKPLGVSVLHVVHLADMRYVPRLISGCHKDVPNYEVGGIAQHQSFIDVEGNFYFKLKSKDRECFNGYVYNFEVEKSHTYCTFSSKVHNCYWFMEWDDKKKMWSRAVMLPPEEVYIFQYPFSENKRVEYRPQRLISLIKSQGEGETASETPKGDYDRSAMNEKIVEGVPEEMKEMVLKEGCIVMDTDPMTGSFVHHIARRRSPYMDLGASVLERVLVPMLQKEHYRYTQLSLASRNMTPKNLITAPGLMPNELDDLRTQVDLSYMDPEYSVITNYEVTWQQIGVQERMLDFSREYEQIENQVFAGLGVTRELLTGEGAFSGTKITIEILNTMFLLTREVLRNFIEKQIFIPVCEAHGWFEEDKNGAKKYWYPQIGFNRLTIRDNAEVFDSLFQLYSKGSLPVEVIYELFNLNSEEMHAKLLAGMFTAKDSTFNRMSEEVNTEVGRAVVQQTDIVEKVSKYLGLKFIGPPEQEGGGEGGGDGFQQEDAPQTDGGVAPEGEGGGQEADQGQDQGAEAEGSQPDPEAIAKEVADSLPPDASPQDIDEALQAVADEAGG